MGGWDYEPQAAERSKQLQLVADFRQFNFEACQKVANSVGFKTCGMIGGKCYIGK